MHIELAPPTDDRPAGQLKDGSVIPLSRAAPIPPPSRRLASVSILLNGGGLAQLQEINQSFAKALAGREGDIAVCSPSWTSSFPSSTSQTDDIISASESLNSLAGQLAAKGQDRRSRADHRSAGAGGIGRFHEPSWPTPSTGLASSAPSRPSTVNQTKESLVNNLRNIAPVLRSLADAGPALTKGLDFISTYPWVKSTLANWFRGDFANISLVVDLTLCRIDSACSPVPGGKGTSPNSNCSGAAPSGRCRARTPRATR